MSRRLVELVLVVLVVGGAMAWWSSSPEPPAQTVVPITPTAASSVGPGFELPTLEGGTAIHAAGEGPLLMFLTAPGCGGCRARAPQDKEAYELAKRYGVPVWSLLVYSDEAGARRFVEETSQPAERHLLDSDARIAVATYGGSDASCWVLLNGQGEIVYQGGSDPAALGAQLDHWRGAAER